MILVILMLASVLSSIDVYELQEENNYEETSSRSGADPEVVSITEPRETSTSPLGEQVNTLLAGREVDFKAWFRNSGDADLTDLKYELNIYNSENGNPTTIAKDASGNDLSWDNPTVICSTGCDATALAAGEYLNGGETTLKDAAGNIILWNPLAGDYHVEIKLISPYNSDPGNDEQTIFVSVKNFMDIDVSLTWLDDDGNPQAGSTEGTDDKEFVVTVAYENPSQTDSNIRNTTIEITTEGATVSGSSSYVVIGESHVVEVYRNSTDLSQTQTDTRMVIGSDGSLNGNFYESVDSSPITVTVPANGEYSVTATLLSFNTYGPCGNGDLCETQLDNSGDEFQGNNADTIYGSAETFDDIELVDFYLAEYSTDADTGDDVIDRLDVVGGEVADTMSPGSYLLVAEVLNTASNSDRVYDWNMSFDMTDMLTNNVISSFDGDDCPSAVSFGYESHQFLGSTDKITTGDDLGVVCQTLMIDTGMFELEAHANMLGLVVGNDTDNTLTTLKQEDNMANNLKSIRMNVENFAPVIVSFDGPKESVPIGTLMTFNVNAIDVEGDNLEYSWSMTDVPEIGCETDECKITADISMVPSVTVFVTVSDPYGGERTGQITANVVNQETFDSDGLANGVVVDYTIAYSSSGLDVVFANSSLDPIQLSQCVGTYTPAASFSVTPSTNYNSDVVSSQSMEIVFSGNLGVTQFWIEIDGQYGLGSSSAPAVGEGNVQSYTYNFPSGEMLEESTFYLLSEDCEVPSIPSNSVTSVTAEARIGGGIGMTWGAVLGSDESVTITVCEGASGCQNPIYTKSYSETDGFSDNVPGTLTTHDTLYTVEAKICNDNGCSDSKTASETADKQVDDISAANVAISSVGETWSLTWDTAGADANSGDLKGWHVCWKKSSFDATEAQSMISNGDCQETENNNITINKYTQAGMFTVHFAVMPYDEVRNVAATDSDATIDYNREADEPADSGSTTTDSDASSDVPVWTWGVIGGVVVVAFVVGAFILSRGDDEEGDDKEYDY